MRFGIRRKMLGPDTGNGAGGGQPTPAQTDQVAAATILAKAVADSLAPLRDELRGLRDEVVALKTAKATNHMDGLPTARDEGPVTSGQAQVKAPVGVSFARVVKAQLLSKMSGSSDVRDVLRRQGYAAEAKSIETEIDRRQKALGQTVFVDGGALVPTEYSSEIITLLTNQTVVRKMGVMQIPMGASLDLTEETQLPTAYWVGENQPVTPSATKYGGQKLSEKTLIALVPFSNSLVRNASVAVEELVRNSIVTAIALKEDYSAIFSEGGQFSPRGIQSLVDASHYYAATAVAPKAPTLPEVKAELAKVIGNVETANIPLMGMGWIMSPRTKQYLYSVTDSLGNSPFQASIDAGQLNGYPFLVTNQIPNNLNTDESRLIFGSWPQFMIAESNPMEVEAFPNATYDSTGTGTIVSGISSDQSVIRAMVHEDFGMRYRKAFVVVKVRWGAA
jgi:HK97 family phage major capsid protein